MRKYPACFFCLGFILFLYLAVLFYKEKLPQWSFQDLEGQELIFSGRVYQKECRNGHSILYLNRAAVCGKYQATQHNYISCDRPEGILCYLKEGEELPLMGETVLVRGRLSGFRAAGNPGEFDAQSYYKILGLDFSVMSGEIVRRGEKYDGYGEGLYRLRRYLSAVLEEVYGEQEASVMKAVLLGEKADMDGELRKLYQKSGIAHVLAVSGLHISFLGMGLYRLLRTCRIPLRPAAFLSFVLLYSYGAMLHAGPSAFRAVFMVSLQLLSEVKGRSYDMLTAMSLSAAIQLLGRPLYLLHSGFLLSYGAILGIGLVYPVLREQAGEWIRMSKVKLPLSPLQAGLGITLVTLPVLLWNFYEFPPYSFLVNLLVVPLMGVLLASGAASLAAGCLYVPAGQAAALFCRGILWLYEKICRISEELPGSSMVTGKPHIWQILCYAGLLLLLLYWRKRMTGALLWLTVLASFYLMTRSFATDFTVTVLDVGQGDGIVIRDEYGGVCLIDGGSSSESRLAEYRLIPFLKSQGIDRIDYAFVSHMDSDHISGLEELLDGEDIRIGRIVFPDLKEMDEDYMRLRKKAIDAGSGVCRLGKGERVGINGMSISCLHPDGRPYADRNDASMVLLWQYQGFRALFTGDLGEKGEEAVLESFGKSLENITLLKVGHHGSATSSGEGFLDRTKPELSLISCGEGNRYGHPSPVTVKRLDDRNSLVLVTKDRGAVTVRVKKGRVRVECFR